MKFRFSDLEQKRGIPFVLTTSTIYLSGRVLALGIYEKLSAGKILYWQILNCDKTIGVLPDNQTVKSHHN